MNGIKGGTVFPGHLYDAVCLFWIKRSFHFFAFYILHCNTKLDPNPVPIFSSKQTVVGIQYNFFEVNYFSPLRACAIRDK